MELPDELCVNVNEEDIAEGEPQDPKHCPIALAIRRAYPDVSVNIYLQNVEVDGVSYTHPTESLHFIDMFDDYADRDEQPDDYKQVVHPREFCFEKELTQDTYNLP